jgi:hypothetical protein
MSAEAADPAYKWPKHIKTVNRGTVIGAVGNFYQAFKEGFSIKHDQTLLTYGQCIEDIPNSASELAFITVRILNDWNNQTVVG